MENITVNAAIVQESFRKKGVVVLPLRVYERIKEKLTRLDSEAKVLQIVAEGERVSRRKAQSKEYWAYSVDEHYRVLFRFEKKNSAIYFDIGTHDIYK